ncbi:MAG: 3-isopropylmalate dehydrogenase [Chloroflexota bacterium]|nr:3-isopropylmalate dehydrogenase [Chloroflexota bacterium]
MQATIIILPGDGIGPEVTHEAARVLRAIADAYHHTFHFEEHLIGGAAIDATGTALPEETLAACRGADAVLLGAVGGPKWDDPRADVRPEQGLLAIRKSLGLFSNVRPIQVTPFLAQSSPLRPSIVEGTDIVVVRELTGGIYFGPREEADREGEMGSRSAYDTMLYRDEEIARVVRVAAQMARERSRKLTSVDKANVLASSRLWRRVVSEVVATEFPELTLEHVLVDAMAMHLIRRPRDFDVIVTGNLFGDILTDEASQIAGSMGLLPSASLGASGTPGLYEPIHGSAPDIAGQGIANPLAAILSAALLLRHSLALPGEATRIEAAVTAVLADGARTADIARGDEPTLSTTEMTDRVIEALSSRTLNFHQERADHDSPCISL